MADRAVPMKKQSTATNKTDRLPYLSVAIPKYGDTTALNSMAIP